MPVWPCCSLFCSRGIDLETGGDAFCIVNNLDENPFFLCGSFAKFYKFETQKASCELQVLAYY